MSIEVNEIWDLGDEMDARFDRLEKMIKDRVPDKYREALLRIIECYENTDSNISAAHAMVRIAREAVQ